MQERTLARDDGAEPEETMARVEFTTPERIMVIDENAETAHATETASLFPLSQHLLELSQEVPTTPSTTKYPSDANCWSQI